MARNTLEAVFGALGAGLTGYGRDAARRREEQQAEIARQDELARTLAERQLRIFQSGLEEAAPATQRAQNVGQFGQMAQAAQGAMPAPMSAVGRALQSAGSGMQTDIQRGRRVTIGGTEYVQPFSRTAQGIEERELQRQAQQASIARQQQLADEERRNAQQLERELAVVRERGKQELLIARAREGGVARTGAIRPPTEGQERNAVYWGLMSNATRELEALRDNPEIRPFMITAYLNTPGATFGRPALNDAEQQFIRAAQDFTAGVLRKETGAAATKPEVAQTLERYIEMGGDEPGSRNAKMEARRRVTDMMYRAAIPALRYQQLMALEEATMQTAQPEAQPSGRQAQTTRPPLDSFWGTP